MKRKKRASPNIQVNKRKKKINRTKARKNIAKEAQASNNAGFLNIDTILKDKEIEISEKDLEVDSEDDSEPIAELLEEQITDAINFVNKPLDRLHKVKEYLNRREAEIGYISFNTTLHRKAK